MRISKETLTLLVQAEDYDAVRLQERLEEIESPIQRERAFMYYNSEINQFQLYVPPAITRTTTMTGMPAVRLLPGAYSMLPHGRTATSPGFAVADSATLDNLADSFLDQLTEVVK